MPRTTSQALAGKTPYTHLTLPCGAELAVDPLPGRNTVALFFRVLVGSSDDPVGTEGLAYVVERTLSKGTRSYDGRGLADAFDRIGAQWSTASGRQSTHLRVLCLPEFVGEVITLAIELLRYPTFPDEACSVAVELARQELRAMEDEPQDLLRVLIQKLTLGPRLGRPVLGTPESLGLITPARVRGFWEEHYHSGRLQVAAAGPIAAEVLARQVEIAFAGWGRPQWAGREPVALDLQPQTAHQAKELEQEHLALTLPGLPKTAADFPVETVLLGVLSGGMSGRLFTEVREKQGLVYWVGAWHEQPRGAGVIYLGASTTPERCDKTYRTLRRELCRLAEDLSAEEVHRARDSIIAQFETADDLTRARAAGLSDDLVHFGRPIDRQEKLAALRGVTLARARSYASRLPLDRVCVATLGPRPLEL